ncbi:MAG: hypothetical protein U5J78_00630 [Parasphingorhabdus sp.]|nr:hypothetical protein [Parasphingorhabdus sp.]
MQFADHNDAAGWRPFVFGIAAKVAMLRGDKSLALALFAKAFDGVDPTKSDMLFREYHQSASQLYEQIGDKDTALVHLKAYQRLEAEAQNLTASTASQLVAAKFDSANQKLKISQLKEGQLKRDIEIERQKTAFRTTLFLGLQPQPASYSALSFSAFSKCAKTGTRCGRRMNSLTVANSSLEKALQAKTEFLAMTSHEIRTPLEWDIGDDSSSVSRPECRNESA